jgi:DNA-binding NtrC family response regulator
VVGQAAPARVLVLDDEPSIRLLCRVVLELGGFEIVEAASVAEARRALDGVDVVVLDLNLRGEQSTELVAECQAREPRLPVILLTGSAELGGENAPTADAVLGKPFDIEELVALVRELGGAARDAAGRE